MTKRYFLTLDNFLDKYSPNNSVTKHSPHKFYNLLKAEHNKNKKDHALF